MSVNLPGESPLYALLNEIMKASLGGTPLVAISMAVALPDLCVSLVSEDGRTDAKRYRQWCADNLTGTYFSFVTPDDLYSIRCGVLHNGRVGDLKNGVARVIFMLPCTMAAPIVNCKINDSWVYSAEEFCRNICQAVHDWSEAHRDDPQMIANLPNLIQYREGGFAPYIGGVTVLA